MPTKCNETHSFFSYFLLDASPFSTIIWFRHPKQCIFQHCCESAMREAAENNIFNRPTLGLISPAWQRTGCEIANLQQEGCKYHSTPGRQKHNFLPLLFSPLSLLRTLLLVSLRKKDSNKNSNSNTFSPLQLFLFHRKGKKGSLYINISKTVIIGFPDKQYCHVKNWYS